MVGSIRLPSSAVVAMVEPEMAENTVPATMAMTERRPGTLRIKSEKASIALSATPEWNSTSPINTKNGIGVSEKLVTDCTAFRASCDSPCSPPRNMSAATILMARKPNATDSPRLISATRPPNRMMLASIQFMASAHRGCFDAAARLAADQPVEAKGEFDGQQRKAHRQRPQQPPFREQKVLDGDRAQHGAVERHLEAVAHHDKTDR